MKVWDRIAALSLSISAATLAIDGALKSAPNVSAELPGFASSRLWPFLPLVFLLVAGGVLLAQFVLKHRRQYSPVNISHKKFSNEAVLLDGHSYVYNATTPLMFNHNLINGPVRVKTDSEQVGRTIALITGFGMLKPGITLEAGSDSFVEAPKFKT